MPSSLFDLSNRVAVVIGGTGTLGGAMARALGASGARVAVCGRNAERGAERVAELAESKVDAAFFALDALDPAAVSDTAAKIEADFGPVHTLVNAAGGNHPDATLAPGDDYCDLPLDAWRSVFDLNLVGGALLPSQAFGRKMVERGEGSIVNIASMSGMIPLSRVVAYSAAKAAVLNLTQFLAREWAPTGVRVNAISPGFFPADQNRRLLMNEDGSYTERGGQIINHTPMGRFGKAEELDGAVVWLASDGSTFVTGQNLVVDGGFSSTTI
ncbi:putative oxidoreductase UxuB [Planctomycetes bacterium MalM25]|nr:putative oxidoreductase UxuB [Planctomycetes bacterium MalM25]